MKTNQDYKNAALAALKGNWGPAVVATLAILAISMVASYLPIIGLVVMPLVSWPLSVGYYAAVRKLYVDGDAKVTENIFGIAFGNYVHNVYGMLLMGVYVFLWSLLFVVPGVIKGLAYALTPFILNEKPELSANEAIELSMKMMDGHKMELFLLYLSFIGWYLLGIFTLCIGYLWLMPYQYTTIVAFYEDVKAEYEAKQVVA